MKTTPPAGPASNPTGRRPGPAWGLGSGPAGDYRRLLVPAALPERGAAQFAAAVALVLAGYGEEQPRFAIARSESEQPTLVDWHGVGLHPQTPLTELEESAARLLARPRDPVPGEHDAHLTYLTLVLRESDSDAPASDPHGPTPLTLTWTQSTHGQPTLTVDYDLAAVDPQIAAQFVLQVGRAAAALAPNHPSTRIADLELLTPAERNHILATGATPAPPAEPTTIHQAFRRQAAAHPEATALSAGPVRLTYRELDARSDRMAAGLQNLGAEAGSMVGVCLPRDADLVVVLLAVLKSGAAYVPLDPGYPTERLAYMAADAELTIVITAPDMIARIPGPKAVTPEDLSALAAPDAVPHPAATPDDPAYTIYTSGSTGRPKGVVVPHRNVSTLINATSAEFGLDERDVWSFFHSSAFDFSVWEIWGALLTGGRVAVVPYFTSRSAEEFHALLIREHVTVLSQTPSAFWALENADRERGGDLAVRLVVFGGEPLDPRLLAGWFERRADSGCRMVNMYGITETTVHVTHRTVTPQDAAAGSPSVGRALAGWAVSVRDARGRVLPFGAAGEIHVAGDAVADRYLNRPDLTAERFIRDPATGDRAYRSGDLGRLHPAGSLDHLGRIDDQVKIRGFRIELGEVRAALLAAPGVRAADVLREEGEPDDPGSARLAAYVVLDGSCSAAQVRRSVADRLPEHMVPAVFVDLPALPLTSNGKVDRSALADFSREHRRIGPAADRQATETTEPGRPTEAAQASAAASDFAIADVVLAAWRDVLGPEIGADDDWFESGGNSLLAVKLMRLLRAGSPAPLTLRDLYRHPTAAEIARLIESRADEADHMTTDPRTNNPRTTDRAAGPAPAPAQEVTPT